VCLTQRVVADDLCAVNFLFVYALDSGGRIDVVEIRVDTGKAFGANQFFFV